MKTYMHAIIIILNVWFMASVINSTKIEELIGYSLIYFLSQIFILIGYLIYKYENTK